MQLKYGYSVVTQSDCGKDFEAGLKNQSESTSTKKVDTFFQ